MKGTFPILGWIAVILAFLVSFYVDLTNTMAGGAVDLRNHITGIRLLMHGMDAYHYKWHDGDLPEDADLRNNPSLPVTKTTVTPATLMLHLPFAALPYRTTQFLWLFAQWLMLLGTACLWWRLCTTSLTRWTVVLFVTAFTYTAAWRWEAERGQAYLLFTFLFTCWQVATMDSKRSNGFLAGCVMGFLVPLRPPFALLLPFVVLHRRGQLLGTTVGLLVGIGLPLLMNLNCWAEYFSAMQTYSILYRYGINPPHAPLHYPPTIEGMPLNIIGNLMPFHAGDFSVHGLLRSLGLEPFPDWPPLFLVTLLFTFWLWRTREQPTGLMLPGLAAWFFLTDLFLPAIRFGYHDIFILNVILCGIATANKFPWAIWPCLLALPIDWAVYAYLPGNRWFINLPAFLLTLGAILSLFPSNTSLPLPLSREKDAHR